MRLTEEVWGFKVPSKGEFYLISGPMTGHDDLNLPTIRRVSRSLERVNITAYNPFMFMEPEALWKHDDHFFRSQYLPVVTHSRCAGIIVLPGWMYSEGATTEVINAERFGKPQFVYRVMVDIEDGTLHPHLQLLKREAICV